MVSSPNGLRNAQKRVQTTSPVPRFYSLLLYSIFILKPARRIKTTQGRNKRAEQDFKILVFSPNGLRNAKKRVQNGITGPASLLPPALSSF
jgi:hypothetical protein